MANFYQSPVRPDEIYHGIFSNIGKSWSKHKYLKKIGNRYFYTADQIRAYMNRGAKAAGKAIYNAAGGKYKKAANAATKTANSYRKRASGYDKEAQNLSNKAARLRGRAGAAYKQRDAENAAGRRIGTMQSGKIAKKMGLESSAYDKKATEGRRKKAAEHYTNARKYDAAGKKAEGKAREYNSSINTARAKARNNRTIAGDYDRDASRANSKYKKSLAGKYDYIKKVGVKKAVGDAIKRLSKAAGKAGAVAAKNASKAASQTAKNASKLAKSVSKEANKQFKKASRAGYEAAGGKYKTSAEKERKLAKAYNKAATSRSQEAKRTSDKMGIFKGWKGTDGYKKSQQLKKDAANSKSQASYHSKRALYEQKQYENSLAGRIDKLTRKKKKKR